ncbi:MAG: TIGR02147 family protein [Chitinispirillaceae bacterium]|nr:TIGR02147 family protein [Chitinispirillaceae bacterium]
MPQIYAYTNSRQFLKDYYEERKRARPSFSYRYFANKAGFKSKSFIYKVITGQKALSKDAVFALAQAMELKKQETEYFEAIVNFTQAKSAREREFYFNHIQSFSKNRLTTQLRRDQFDYFSKWYLPAVREMVTYLDFKDDFKVLARSLNPPITTVQARNAVKLLLKLKLIERLPSGRYRQTDKAVTTGSEMKSLAVTMFQKENLQLAAESLERHDSRDRDLSTLTVGVTEEGVGHIAEEIAQFRKRLVALVEKEEPVDRVYQINFQLFPLSTLPGRG